MFELLQVSINKHWSFNYCFEYPGNKFSEPDFYHTLRLKFKLLSAHGVSQQFKVENILFEGGWG